MAEDPLDQFRLATFNEAHDLHLPAAARALQPVAFVHPLDQHRPQRNVAGRHYLTKAELNALYFATHYMEQPRGWTNGYSIGVLLAIRNRFIFNYGLKPGTIWQTKSIHEPTLWRHVYWDQESLIDTTHIVTHLRSRRS